MGSSMDAAVAAGDWRTQLQPEARQRIVNNIMETLKMHLPISVPEGLKELRKIAIRFEEKIYTAATSQSDYLRKISMKMLSMVTETQQTAPINPAMSNAGAVNQNHADPGSLGMQSQVNNPGQSLALPNRHALLSQNLQNNPSAVVSGSSGLGPALPSIAGLGQSNMSGVLLASNLQNISGISHGYVNNSMAQGAQPDIYTNPQRQMQGRQQQQQIISQQQQQQQQQSQNPLYQHQLQQQMLSQKHQQQQQSLIPTNRLQSTQPSLMQMPSGLQSNQSNIQQTQDASTQLAQQFGLQQGQLNQIQQSVPSLLQQNPQLVSRQQQAQPLHQQVSSLQQQASPISQQTTFSQQQHMMGHQRNMSNMQHSQLLRQQTSIADIQQQQRLPIQQNILSMQQQKQQKQQKQQQQRQMMNQQSLALQQQQQQLGSQNNMSGLQQQQQLLRPLSSISNMQPQQRVILMQKNAAHQQQQQQQQQQQRQQYLLSLMQSQGQQSQQQSTQQQFMSQFQPQLQQQLLMQQQATPLQWEMQQRIQGSGPLLQAQNAMEQTPFIQAQRGLPEVSSSTSMESTSQTGVMDWQVKCYQKSQVNNTGQSLDIPDRQSPLPQNLKNNTSADLPGSSGTCPLPSMAGHGQSNISGVSHASNLQNISGIPHGSVNSSMARGAQPDMYANPQRRIQGGKSSDPVSEKGSPEDPTFSRRICIDCSGKRQEPTFSCPICMGALASPISTLCGHIFCEVCIIAAIKRRKECPTCRTKLRGRNYIHRVYLPTVD